MAHSGAGSAVDAEPDSAVQADAAARKPELIVDLTRRRAASGLSQAGVAKLMGTSQPAVARLESGRHDVQLSSVSRYAEVLGLSLGLVEAGNAQAGAAGARPEVDAPEALPEGKAFLDRPPQAAPPPVGAGPTGQPERVPRDSGTVVARETPGWPEPGHALTRRQREMLQVIRDSVQRRGYPPSMREIGEAVGLASASSVSYQLSVLESMGHVRRDAGRARTVEVRLPGQPAARPDGETDEGGVTGSGPSKTAYVPVVSHRAAGVLTLADQGIEDVFSLPRQIVGEGNLFLFKVNDECMSGAHIEQGDWVAVRRQRNVGQGDIVAALVDDAPTVRTFRQSGGDRWLMTSNPSYPGISADKATILGPVVGLVRRFG